MSSERAPADPAARRRREDLRRAGPAQVIEVVQDATKTPDSIAYLLDRVLAIDARTEPRLQVPVEGRAGRRPRRHPPQERRAIHITRH